MIFLIIFLLFSHVNENSDEFFVCEDPTLLVDGVVVSSETVWVNDTHYNIYGGFPSPLEREEKSELLLFAWSKTAVETKFNITYENGLTIKDKSNNETAPCSNLISYILKCYINYWRKR